MPAFSEPLDSRVQQSLRACYESLLRRGELSPCTLPFDIAALTGAVDHR